MSNPHPTIRLEIREHIAHLTLTRPEAANTLNLQMGREFVAAAAALRANPAVRAVLLSGAGKNFCFGGDLRGMSSAGADATRPEAYLTELTTDLHAGMTHLARMDAPVIAAVQGTAAGAGLGLVLAADLAIAAKSARFAPAYTAVGLTPDAGCSFLLPRAAGYKRAMELFLTNRVLDAQEALDWGLVNQVVEDAKLPETAAALAGRLAAGPAGAFGAVKRLLAESEPGWEAQLARESRLIAARRESAEGREGVAAFLEKRSASFL
ncbi:MAG TPA: enoyl-CoA hydratase/isomerase family protein [Steroidobacteraceae bacterium]|nr:enoyl-CoA hydratase/isomerase family protein [Steroidobacteraceae bacterium]